MKKIVYLIAPLMAVPFITGCQKAAVTHTASFVEGTSLALKFTDEQNKYIERDQGVTVTEGKDFVFHVEVLQGNDNANYENYITKESFFISINDFSYLDFSFAIEKVDPDDTDHIIKAKITIPGKVIDGDIKIGALAFKADCYLYYLPFLFGVSYTVTGTGVEDHGGYGYKKSDTPLKITFKAEEGLQLPKKENIVYTIDGDNIVTAGTNYDESNGNLTINPGEVTEYITFAARAHEYSFIERLPWSYIKSISTSGYAPYLFEIGETKTIKISEKVEHTVQIIGFNHDDLADGSGKAGITFQFKTLLSDKDGNAITTHWSDTTSREIANHNYIDSTLNKLLINSLDSFPEDLKKEGMIERVKKNVGIYSDGWKLKEDYSTFLFVLAQAETNKDPAEHVVPNEGTVYDYYKNKSGTELYNLRKLKDAKGNEYAYWLRSPHNNAGGDAAYAVGEDGTVNSDGQFCRAHYYAFAPCFCI